MGNVIDNSLFVDVEKFNLAVRQYTTYNLITTQRKSVWENCTLYFFIKKWRKTHGRNKCNNDSRGNAG